MIRRYRRIRAIAFRHIHEAMRNPDRIADILFWPFVDVVTWSLFSRFLFHRGLSQPSQLVAGIALWGAFRAFQRDMAVGFLSDVWSRNMSGLLSSPLSSAEYLVGLSCVNLAKVALSLGLIALICNLLTGVPGPLLSLQLLAPLSILLISGGAVGLFVTSLILRFSSRVQTLAYGLAGLLLPISCVFYPLTTLPGTLRIAAGWLPTTLAFELMRGDLKGFGLVAPVFFEGLALAMICLCAAAVLFSRMLHAARRNGRLVRMD